MSAALIAPMPCTDQAELLRAFDLPIALMQDAEALERITLELVETKAADGVRYVEIRWGPRLHVSRGLSLADGIAAVCAGARAGAAGTGTVVLTILDGTALARPGGQRGAGRDHAARFIDEGLTGWDLAGPEARIPRCRWTTHERTRPPARSACACIACRGVGRRGAGHRALAVEPDRIAHGPGTIDDPELCAELQARGIGLDRARPRTGRPPSCRR